MLRALAAKIRIYASKAQGLSTSYENFRAMAVKPATTRKAPAGRSLRHLNKIRQAPAKNLDDILFKAELCAVLEPYEFKRHQVVAHSIINDLLSAGCTWMQSSANE